METTQIIKDVIQHYQWLKNFSQEKAADPKLTAGVMLMHLYGLIVFPWEQLQKQIRTQKLIRKVPLSKWCTYRIVNQAPHLERKVLTVYSTLHILRNAISHATITIDPDLTFVFRERRGTTLKFTINELEDFLDHWLKIIDQLEIQPK